MAGSDHLSMDSPPLTLAGSAPGESDWKLSSDHIGIDIGALVQGVLE